MDIIKEQIIQETLKGNYEVFSSIIRKYQQQIFAYIYKIVKNYQDAEDLTQDTFTKALKNIGNLKNVDYMKSWLYQIAYRTTLNYINKKSVKSLVLFKDPSTIDVISYTSDYFSNEFSEEINDIFKLLNVKEHTLLTLRIIEDMSFKEISNIMKKPPSVLRKRYERLIKKIKNELSDWEGVLI